ncbi:MAG: hypothetical protein ACT4TC_20285 [Myxococcaceae bacterium]
MSLPISSLGPRFQNPTEPATEGTFDQGVGIAELVRCDDTATCESGEMQKLKQSALAVDGYGGLLVDGFEGVGVGDLDSRITRGEIETFRQQLEEAAQGGPALSQFSGPEQVIEQYQSVLGLELKMQELHQEQEQEQALASQIDDVATDAGGARIGNSDGRLSAEELQAFVDRRQGLTDQQSQAQNEILLPLADRLVSRLKAHESPNPFTEFQLAASPIGVARDGG